MEKRKWTRPEVAGEMFEANEYVAACITGMIQCAYPGNGKTNGDTTKFDDYNGKESGYEFIGSQIQRNRPIYNISGYTAKAGTYYGVTWTSKDGAYNSSEYSHIGRLVITDIDSAHPNHS